MNSTFNYPLSGPVTQAINPLEFWFKSASSQLGFINLHYTQSSDHRLEQAIIEDAASYGKQLGRINDLLMTLLEHQQLDELDSEQQRTVDAFKDMNAEIATVKAKRYNPEQFMDSVNDMLSQLRTLKTTDRAAYERAVRRLRAELDNE